MCFHEMIEIHMGQSLLWQTYFCVNLKGGSFFKQKKETCVKLAYFQIPLGSQMTYTLKVMKNFKAITMSCILMNQFSRKKRKILRKSRFWVFQQKYTIENLQFLSFAFISVTCPIRVATHHLRYFMLQLVLEFIILQGKQQTT